jgi:hypothetical protein
MVLRQLQAELASLYETPLAYDVYDFLITDARLAAALTPSDAPQTNRERLLVSQDEDESRLSLYLDAEILATLERDDPMIALHDGNLQEFMLALEGVSHLNYLLWHAGQDSQVSLLEIELQGEVDKYVTAAKLIAHQHRGRIPHVLHHYLFEAVRYAEDLSAEARNRYQEANYYAARYCHSLRNRFPQHHYQPSFLRELRGFYRLSQNAKIRHIRAADR